MRDSPILMRRMLALRQFPLFAHADLGELATIAENVAERRFDAGALVAPADLSALHLVVDGGLEVGTLLVAPRQVHGALEISARRPAPAPAIARGPTRTLVLDASDYFEVLEDNFGLLLSVIRDLAARVVPLGVARRPSEDFGGTPLGLVERMIVLRRLAPFEAARLEAIAILAHAATEVRWPAGAIIQRANTPADRASIILEGTLQSASGIHGSDHVLGLLETLAALPHADTIEATTPVRALVTHGGTILDVLEDHTDLALAMMQAFARTLVDHEARMLCAATVPTAETARDLGAHHPNTWRTS